MSFARLNEKQLPESLLKRIQEMENRIIQLEREVSELKKPKQKEK